jgi:uncharacterized protein YeaO (DUF488 family)
MACAPFRGGNSREVVFMPIKTKRWNDPKDADEVFRLLICRYRPRGVRKEDETWDTWCPDLGPSKELHAAFYGKNGPPITWDDYRQRYLKEMEAQQEYINQLAELAAEGKTITLLCSSACEDASRCHRTLLQELIEARLPVKSERTPEQAKGANG